MGSNNVETVDKGASVGGTFGADLSSSIVVFLVALPLCMGIAIASGVPPTQGLITGIVGGVIVGLFQGGPMSVSGPAAGLVVIVAGVIAEHGIPGLGLVVLLAGAMQLAAGSVGGGRWFRAVPPSVVHGMLAGIGVLILASQFHVMLDDKPRSGGLANILSIPEGFWKAIAPSGDLPHREAAGTGIVTIVVMLLWMRVPERFRTWAPAPLMGVVVGSAFANLLSFPIAFVDVPSNIFASVTLPGVPSWATVTPLLGAAVVMAIVASAETLLCAAAVDRMHHGDRTNFNKELMAQGAGNMICGALGALPMTAVIVRSSANVSAGAKTRLSAILHGIWLLVLVGVAPQVLTVIPVASLAAVLVYTGAKLASPKVLKELKPYGRAETVIFLITTAAVVVTDLLTGVLLGLGLAVGRLLLRLSSLKITMEDDAESKRTVMHLSGSATFLRLADLSDALEGVAPDRELHLHFDSLDYVDHAILELFRAWADQHQSRGGTVVFDWEVLEHKYHFNANRNDSAAPPVPFVSRKKESVSKPSERLAESS